MKIVIAATGASGTIYLQRLLEQIDCGANEVHLVLSADRTAGRRGPAFRKRSERSLRERVCPFRRDGDRSLFDGDSRSNCYRHW